MPKAKKIDKVAVPIGLVMNDWAKQGKSVYNTPDGLELSQGSFHGGSTFNAEIYLKPADAEELVKAIMAGNQPVFWITLRDPKEIVKPCGQCGSSHVVRLDNSAKFCEECRYEEWDDVHVLSDPM